MGEQTMMSVEYVRAKNNARARRHYARNAEKLCARAAVWRAENPEYVAAYQKQYNADNIMTKRRKRVDAYARDPEAGRVAARDYAEANPEKVKVSRDRNALKHREHNKDVRRKWKDENRETTNRQRREAGKRNRETEKIHGHNYRARKRALPNTLTETEWQCILAEQEYACYYCGGDAATLVVEHMIPLSKGGGTTKDNCCGSCPSCNSSKRDRTVAEFIAYRIDIGKPLTGRVVS